jgi:hypothetical protein
VQGSLPAINVKFLFILNNLMKTSDRINNQPETPCMCVFVFKTEFKVSKSIPKSNFTPAEIQTIGFQFFDGTVLLRFHIPDYNYRTIHKIYQCAHVVEG